MLTNQKPMQNVDQKALSEITGHRHFINLSPVALNHFAKHAEVVTLRKGEVLWKRGEPAAYFAYVVRGVVDIVRATSEGNEKITAIFGPGDLIGLSAYLRASSFPAAAKICAGDSQIIKFSIDPKDFAFNDRVLMEIKDWLQEMLLIHEKILLEKIDIASGKNLEVKIYRLLVHLADRFGIHMNHDKDFIPLPITKTQISDYVESKVESTIRLLNKWEKNGLIEIKHEGVYVPDMNAIKNHVANC